MKMPSLTDTAVKVRAYLTDETFGFQHWRAAQFSAPAHDKFGVLQLFETEAERDAALASLRSGEGAMSEREALEQVTQRLCSFNCDAESSCGCIAHRMYRALRASAPAGEACHGDCVIRTASCRSDCTGRLVPPALPALAPLERLVEQMQDFARTAPSGQQTRQKSAREMVGHFAYELASVLAALQGQERRADERDGR